MARTSLDGRRFAMANQTDGSGYEAPTRWVADETIALEPHVHAVQRARLMCAAVFGYRVTGPNGFGLVAGTQAVRAPVLVGHGGKGFAVTAAWSSWRPPSFPGPSPQQWKQCMLRKGADKGKGKGKGKSGIGELSWGYQAPWGAPLGQVQAAQDQYQNADVSQCLVPICAVTQTTRDQWSTAKRAGSLQWC